MTKRQHEDDYTGVVDPDYDQDEFVTEDSDGFLIVTLGQEYGEPWDDVYAGTAQEWDGE